MYMPGLPPEHERLYTRVYAVVRQIPPGKVATYGQIAAIVGDCTARMVGYAMAACPGDVPWQRVINAQGKVSPRADSWGSEVQRLRLEEEGVTFDADHKVNFAEVRWSGPGLEWLLANGFTPHEPSDPGEAPEDVQPRLF
jgi:methylated-DNA-protein-cysteine methyltransferase related protein